MVDQKVSSYTMCYKFQLIFFGELTHTNNSFALG